MIPTCDRPADVERCLNSLALVEYPAWELFLIDQSDDARTEAVADRFNSVLPRMAYVRSAQRGAARTRNAAMTLVHGDIVAFLDDDCTVEPSWLRDVAAVMSRYPGLALVFGSVHRVPSESNRGFVPAYAVTSERTLRGRLAFLRTECMAASMYLRPALWNQVGPIDAETGAGARFAGEDRDYCYRVLASGLPVVETPAITVYHHGARTYEGGSASRLIRRAAFSFGALHMKIVRSGDPFGLVLIAVEMWRNLTRIRWRNLLRRRRPNGLAWIVMYLRGLRAGFQLSVDRKRRLWVVRGQAAKG